MVVADRVEFKRLILQIERDLVAQTHLKALYTVAGTTVAGHRQELRAVAARLTGRRHVSKTRAPRG